MPELIVTADDYGYAPGYNRGILEVARVGAVDAVSAMVEREWCDPAPLLDAGVQIGLHLERGAGVPRQLERFRELFAREPTHLDGHRHCHAASDVALAVAELAASLGIRVRSIDPSHRRLLRSVGARTPDLLIGRLDENEPLPPPELERLPGGVTEWMVHPGYSDTRSGSSYDAGREEDLRLLLARSRGEA